MGERLVESADIMPHEQVLDVAAGNGNASLAAARRFADVTALDYVPALLEGATRRAAANALPLSVVVGSAEALPFADGSFDAVLSTFGVMFCTDHQLAAAEMLRVCRPGGRIALANWTPSGMIGQLFQLIGRYVPPPAGAASPSAWGNESRLLELFPASKARLQISRQHFVFRYASAQHWVDYFRSYYGPVQKAFDALPPERQEHLERDVHKLLQEHARATPRGLAATSEYVEVIATRL